MGQTVTAFFLADNTPIKCGGLGGEKNVAVAVLRLASRLLCVFKVGEIDGSPRLRDT